MGSKLEELYRTLLLVETKGQSTKYMGECLKFLEQVIIDNHAAENEEQEKKNGQKPKEGAA